MKNNSNENMNNPKKEKKKKISIPKDSIYKEDEEIIKNEKKKENIEIIRKRLEKENKFIKFFLKMIFFSFFFLQKFHS